MLHIQLTSTTRQQFVVEAQTIARLVHPNIVRVLDFGEEPNTATPFLVMEYAPNGTLNLAGKTLSPQEVLVYVKQIAAALQYVHDEQLIHRDIKPDKLLLGRKNEVLLSDFGIAVATKYQNKLEAIGTVDYMAPEQIKKMPTPASDQYALAIIVYEWLCGSCPFDGTSMQIAAQHLTTPPPLLHTKNTTISPNIEQVVMKALAKDASQRYPTIQEFANALEQTVVLTQAPRLTATLPGPALSTSSLAATQTATLVPGQSTLASSFIPPAVSRTPAGRCINIYRGHTDFVRAVAWAPDGQRVASGGDDWQVQLWDARTGDNILLYKKQQGQIWAVTWSPDGTRIASGTARQVAQVWNIQSQAIFTTYSEHKTDALSLVFSLVWSPDGMYIASGSADGTVHIWNASTGQPTMLYNGHSAEVNALAWSPDGTRIASASDDKTIHIWDVATKKRLATCTGHTRRVSSVAWSADGKYIASGSDDRTVRIWESGNGSHTAAYQHIKRVRAVAWAPDSTRLATAGDEKTVQVYERATGALLFTCIGHEAGINSIAWSSDGIYIASGSSDGRVRIWQAM